MKKLFLTLACVISLAGVASAQTWLVTGNNGISSSQFLGTKDLKTLDFRTNNLSRMSINPSGYIGMGITPVSSARLSTAFSVPTIIALNAPYSATRGNITGGGGTANGYLGTYYSATLGLSALPASLNYMGVLGVMEISNSFGAGVLGWNRNNKTGGNHYGVYGSANGIPSGTSGATDKNVGIFGSATNNSINIGVYGSASGSDDWGGYFYGRAYVSKQLGIGTESPTSMLSVDATSGMSPLRIETAGLTRMYMSSAGKVGIGTSTPSARFQVRATVDSKAADVSVYGAASSTIYGLDVTATNLSTGMSVGTLTTANGTGVNRAFEASASNGTTNYGVYSIAEAGSGNAYGVYGRATGGTSSNTVYGIYGSSSGASNHWAGYFAGTTYASTLRVGTTDAASGYILSVGGKMICEEVKVALETNWPDYVFADDYKLMPLEELKSHIDKNKHLPGLPSAEAVAAEGGYNVGELQVKLLEKVEELTLYIIRLSEENGELKKALGALKN
ncbi:MAG: hypothetical protein M3Q95_12410 [Bacteroidota bacterium]|nr:hypothetical protein [Bacteroidota bacterium]